MENNLGKKWVAHNKKAYRTWNHKYLIRAIIRMIGQ